MTSHFTKNLSIIPCVAGGVAVGAMAGIALAHVWTPKVCQAKDEKLLFTPGPLTTSSAVRKEMAAKDLGSRDTAFIAVQDSIRTQLLALAGVSETHECVLMQGSGTFTVEATVGCAVPRGGKALVISNGAYGDRIGTICTRLGIEHRMLSFPWTSTPSPAAVAAELAEHPADVVFMVHHETTCGIINDVAGIGAVLKNNEVFCVDSMSGFGGLPLDLTKAGVDFMVSSANKCIPGVPGFAFVLANREKLLATEGNARSLALDLLAQWRGLKKNGQFRFTPPTHALVAFNKALTDHVARGGIAAANKRFGENQQIIQEGLGKLGFKTFVDAKLQSPIITAFAYPTKDFDFENFYTKLSAKGFVLYPGKTKAGDIPCFRVGNIGEIYPAHCRAFISGVAEWLKEEGLSYV